MSYHSATDGRIDDPHVVELFSQDMRWQTWLDVEAALAAAEADLEIIPRSAATTIARCARLDLLDRARIDEATLRTSHTIVPLVWELARMAGEDAGRWVHWGATTQNIVQTGDVLTLRKAHRIFLGLIGELLLSLGRLAREGSKMPMAGRTHGQHAVPATFGYKVAVWIDEMIRHLERLKESEPRVFVAMLGGAAGTFASLGSKGPLVQSSLASRLGLGAMVVPARSIGDHLAEYVCVLGLVASTAGKIGRELYTLMKTEFGEVEEPMPPGTVGSSTMPHKRNPHLCQDIVAGAASVQSVVPLALGAMQVEHEGDRTNTLMMQDAVERACGGMGDVLARLVVVIEGLRLAPARMRANLDLTGGLVMSESVMLRLGSDVGRQRAHEVVYEAAQRAASSDVSFRTLLAADPRVQASIEPGLIEEMLDVSNYTGLCTEMAEEAAERARLTVRNVLGTSIDAGGEPVVPSRD